MRFEALPTEPADLPLRRKILWIDPMRLLELFFTQSTQDSVLVPKLDLPTPVYVKGVYFNHSMDAFGFSICHPSFEPVEPGAMVPDLHCAFEVVKLPRQKQP